MNHIFILVGSSGVGKSTVQESLLAEKDLGLLRAITTTTRKPRPGDVEGVNFYFVSPEEFERMIKDHEFVEYVETFGRSYGTSRKELEGKLAQAPVLMTTDMRGARSIKSLYPNTHVIYLDAPREDLVRRIEERPGTTPEDMERRIKRMDEEKAGAHEADIIFQNPDGQFEETLGQVRSFISQQLTDSVH
jgi:guanylate kinase